MKSMRGWLGLSLLVPGLAQAFCVPPRERICEEYFGSDAIFTGRVISEKTIPDPEDPENASMLCYRLKIAEAFKGKVSGTAEVCTTAASDRRTLEIGNSYLLFALRRNEPAAGDHLWIHDNCHENSGALPDAEPAVTALKEFLGGLSGAMQAEVGGQVTSDRSTEAASGVAGVTIAVIGDGKNYTGKTDAEGRFRIGLPAGHYRVVAADPAGSFAPSDFSRADPAGFDLKYGQCADFQFWPKQ